MTNETIKTVKLHNRGKSQITAGKDENGKNIIFMPNTTVIFPAPIAEKLRRLYPKEVIDQATALDPFKTIDASGAVEGKKAKK